MKRFVCAVIILAITVTSAVLLNKQTIKATDEIINIIELKDTDLLKSCWDRNKILFSVMFSEEKTEKIRILIENAGKNISDNNIQNELKEEMYSLKNVLSVSLSNIL